MNRRVRVSDLVLARASTEFGGERTPDGQPDAYDFESGPLAAAVFAFSEFDRLSWDLVASIRNYSIVDPFFGAVTFTAVLMTDGVVEIADFARDPDYWTIVGEDPEG